MVRQGMTYYYTITAVDKSGNESRRSNEHKTYTETIR
jgi:fibronectin type 3 domain-containing protein